MTIDEHAKVFADKPIVDYNPMAGIEDPLKYCYKIGFGYDAWDAQEPLTNVIAKFLNDKCVIDIEAIVIGSWEEMGSMEISSAPIVEALVAAKERLPKLNGIFIGDVVSEECEISWIMQSDMSPLLLAFPNLEHFRVRGNEGLSLGTLNHTGLKSLVIETGGLSSQVVTQVAAAKLPNLEHLEIWLGTDEYGGDSTIKDLEPLFSDGLFPKLHYLGLRDSEYVDEIAIEIAKAPILKKIKVLDLSLGTLTDKGGKALINCPELSGLEKLDLHYHYLSDEMIDQFRQLGINVDIDDKQDADEDDDYRYPAVTE